MIQNSNRRRFLLGCLGLPALGAAAKSPQVSISSDELNLAHREKEDVADAIRSQIEIPSTFPTPKFHVGQQVEHKLIFEDGEVSIQRGTVVGLNYESDARQCLEWHYLIAWKNCRNLTHDRSWTPDQDEPSFVFESELQAG